MKNTIRRNTSGDDWATPPEFLQKIRERFGDFFDPCPYQHDLKKWDGLSIKWADVNFINPPYSRTLKEAFIRKAFEESKKGNICVMLLPVSTSTKIFHEIVLPNARVEFIRGRLRFCGINSKGEYVTSKTGQHDSMLVIFGSEK